jgi:hypothetical protein
LKQDRKDKSILLKVSKPLCEKMDTVVTKVGMNRTSFIEQSIIRNLKYMNKYELPIIKNRQYNYDVFFSSNNSV